MYEKTISLNIPVLFRNTQKTAFCPFFKKTFNLDKTDDNPDFSINIASKEGLTNELTNQVEVNKDVIQNLSIIVDKLYEMASKRFKKGKIEEPPDIESYNYIELEKGDVWLTYTIKLTIKKGCTETILPNIFLVSAIISQSLTLCAMAVSIHVKGVSAPLTIVLSLNSALFTLLTLMASDTTSSMARIGRYIDYTSCNRWCKDAFRLKDKLMFMGVSTLFMSSWLVNFVSDGIADFSEIEIIDKAGYAANLTFLTDEVISVHAWALTITTSIAGGAFGAHFAMTAAYGISDWFNKNYNAYSENDDIPSAEERDPLLLQHNELNIN